MKLKNNSNFINKTNPEYTNLNKEEVRFYYYRIRNISKSENSYILGNHSHRKLVYENVIILSKDKI